MTNDHPTREEDFDLYALGAFEGEEKQAFEAHIAVCADCSRRLSAARGRIAMLSFAAPRVDVSPDAKQKLMARIFADRVRSHAAGNESGDARQSYDTAREGGRGGLFGRWWAAALTPAAIALVFATVFLWRQNERLSRELAKQRESLASLQKESQESHHAADLLAAHDTVVVPLMPMPGTGQGMGRVTYSTKMGVLMYDGDLAPAPAEKSYQLWLVPMKGDPINAGVFNPKAGQVEHWMMHLPPGVAPKAFAVTLEPVGGMPQPTGPKILSSAAS